MQNVIMASYPFMAPWEKNVLLNWNTETHYSESYIQQWN